MEASIPTLFGRATAVLGEHAELHGGVGELRKLCDALRAGQSATELGALSSLRHFLRRLRRHFAREESDGYFGTMLEAMPAMNIDVGWLQAEHAEMTATLLTLIEMCELGSTKSLAIGLEALIAQFEGHERRETELMQAFLRSDGAAGAP
jgi:hypothetical protein